MDDCLTNIQVALALIFPKLQVRSPTVGACAIAQLPNKTVDVQLTFNHGKNEHWRLGQGTVQAIKQLLEINR